MSSTKVDRTPSQSDVILPMQDPYMSQINDGSKNYEFRKYRLRPSVERFWFYRTAPHSSITHVCYNSHLLFLLLEIYGVNGRYLILHKIISKLRPN
jgi:hypothetical protein